MQLISRLNRKGQSVKRQCVYDSRKTMENQWNDLVSRDENAVYLLVGPIRGDEGKTLSDHIGTYWLTMTMVTKNAKIRTGQ